MDLLLRCGLKIKPPSRSLLCHVEALPIDLLFVRDDDIPTMVSDGVCDMGIVGENVLLEQTIKLRQTIKWQCAANDHNDPCETRVIENKHTNSQVISLKNRSFLAHDGQGDGAVMLDGMTVIKKLGFGRCRLSIALPKNMPFNGASSLQGFCIATSHPHLLKAYLLQHQVEADIRAISGSVEIAPSLEMADAICDLVATGRTLEENHLKEADVLLESQAVLVQAKSPLGTRQQEMVAFLLRRIESVLKAQDSKYILFHAPKASLPLIKDMLPGSETPTIMALEGIADKVAVHVVSRETVFWDTLENLKNIGASSILVLPIEKMLN